MSHRDSYPDAVRAFLEWKEAVADGDEFDAAIAASAVVWAQPATTEREFRVLCTAVRNLIVATTGEERTPQEQRERVQADIRSVREYFEKAGFPAPRNDLALFDIYRFGLVE